MSLIIKFDIVCCEKNDRVIRFYFYLEEAGEI